MPSQSHHDLSPVHELMRHDPQQGFVSRDFTLRNERDDLYVVGDEAGNTATIHAPSGNFQVHLTNMLRHYPVPVSVNGEAAQRAEYQAQPGIRLRYTTPEEFPDGAEHTEVISDCPNYASLILYDGLTYNLGHSGSAHSRTVISNPRIHAEPPNWRRKHFSPVETYLITQRLQVQSANAYERQDTIFSAQTYGVYCIPSQTIVNRIAHQTEESTTAVLRHAQETGRRIIAIHEEPNMVLSWSRLYDNKKILLKPESVKVVIDPDTDGAVAHSLARALYDRSNVALVPVNGASDSENRTTVRPVSLEWQDPTGRVRTLNLLDEHASLDPDPKRFCHEGRDIIMTVEMTRREERGTVYVPLNCAALDTAEYPSFIFDRHRLASVDELSRRLSSAYLSKRHIREEMDDWVRQRAKVLAVMSMEGEAAAFAEELAELARRFSPISRLPRAPVSASMPSGGTLTWTPDL